MASRNRAGAGLQHVRWIGGGSGAGKSTVARQLSADHGLGLYHAEPFSKYVARADPRATPLLQRFMAMDMDERWVNRPPEVMLETFHGFQGEGFDLVIDDLLALPPDPPVLAEGFSLLPRLVAPLLSQPRQAVWLLPTPEFRRAAFESRGSTWTIPNKTSDPQAALANLVARDQLFTEELRGASVPAADHRRRWQRRRGRVGCPGGRGARVVTREAESTGRRPVGSRSALHPEHERAGLAARCR